MSTNLTRLGKGTTRHANGHFSISILKFLLICKVQIKTRNSTFSLRLIMSSNSILRGNNTWKTTKEIDHKMASPAKWQMQIFLHSWSIEGLINRSYACFEEEPTTKVLVIWFAPVLVFIHFQLRIYFNQHTSNVWDQFKGQ